MKYQVMIPVFVNNKVQYLPWANSSGIRFFDSRKQARDFIDIMLPESAYIDGVEDAK